MKFKGAVDNVYAAQVVSIWLASIPTTTISFALSSDATQNSKRATVLKWLFYKIGVVSIKSCSHAETYRIAKTPILTLQTLGIIPDICIYFQRYFLVSHKIRNFASASAPLRLGCHLRVTELTEQREQSDACISSAESWGKSTERSTTEQREQSDACISSAESWGKSTERSTTGRSTTY